MFTVHRSITNPFVQPENGTPWEAIAAFNPSPVRVGDDKYVLYRAASAPEPAGRYGPGAGHAVAVAGDLHERARLVHRQCVAAGDCR